MDTGTMPKTYKAEEVAKILGVTREMVHKLIRYEDLGHIKVGRFIRVTQQQLDTYLGIEREPLPAPRPAAKPVQHGRGFVLQVMRSDGTCAIDVNLTEQKAGERLAQLLKDRTVHGFTVLRGQ